MHFRTANKVSLIFGVLALVFILCLLFFDTVNAAYIVVVSLSVLCLLVCIVVKIVFYRCPHCRGMIPWQSVVGFTRWNRGIARLKWKKCPKCGKPL